jgi:hypothetical protein
MTDEHASADPGRFVSPAAAPSVGRLVSLPLHLADRPLVTPGQRVALGQPVIEHCREQEAVDIPTTAAVVGLRPGDIIDAIPMDESSRLAHGREGANYRARVCEHGRDGITRLIAGGGEVVIGSPLSGLVESVLPSRIDLRADGLAVDAAVGWGRVSAGRLHVAVDGPNDEIQTSRIDVGAAGAILVAGARIDIEALSRARAIGVAGIIVGGVASRHLRRLRTSEARQAAALHAATPFALLGLGGYGRMPIPRHLWELLVAADGRGAGLLPDDRTLIIDGDPALLLQSLDRPAGTVRLLGGEFGVDEGRLVGLAGPRRWPGGAYAPGGFVEVTGPDGGVQRHAVPLGSLERLGPE